MPPHVRFQIWDELATLTDSFGLYKAGKFINYQFKYLFITLFLFKGGGSWDKSFFLQLYNGPKTLLHSTKKYSYKIDNPRLVIFASSHPETMANKFEIEKKSADAFRSISLKQIVVD